ncbi:hypothetical protein [Bacteroides salyersiae]|uniref:hypothetical protein n=1 Tax=Bacteroides salyersiae TaxID=291644 RepID=UPI001C8B3019|nr:hypothetical protein [Bacteroides salyersiae]
MGYIIHIEFTPFTGFTFLNQTPYSSVIQGEGTHPVYRQSCSLHVCPVLTTRMPGTWDAFAQRPENGNGPSPCIADEQSSKAQKVKPVKGVKNIQKRHPKNKKTFTGKKMLHLF